MSENLQNEESTSEKKEASISETESNTNSPNIEVEVENLLISPKPINNEASNSNLPNLNIVTSQNSENSGEENVSNNLSDEVDYLPSYEAATAIPSAPPLILNNDTINESEGNCLSQDSNSEGQLPDVVKLTKSDIKNISIKVNLIRASKRLIKFLERVEYESDLYEGNKVKAAIYRYENIWLPLAAKHSITTLISPPLDVYWVWLVHMLAPQYYEKDCMTILGKVIDHRLLTAKSLERSCDAAKVFWEEYYPDEPWDLTDEHYSDSKYLTATSRITYGLEDAINRQSAFYYQVSLEHYKCKPFLYRAAYRYKQFLALKKAHPNLFLVPCYDMDIVWHAHQIHPLIYKSDTEKILGALFPHDDSVNDRSDGSKLNVSDTVTRDLWLNTFGATFRREGSMFRGDPPANYISDLSETTERASHSSLFHVQISKIKINGNFSNEPLKVKFKREGEKLAEFTLVHFGSDTPQVDVTEMSLNFSVFETVLTQWVVLKLSSTKKFRKFLKMFGKGNFWSMTNLSELFTVDEEGTISKTFCDEDSSATVELEMLVKREYTTNWVPIGIMTGEFMPYILDPVELTSLYGMVTGSKSDNQDIYIAEMATHRLLNESPPMKPQLMEVEVCHSRHFMFSSVKIFADSPSNGRSLIGLAHTLDLNTVPSPMELKCTDESKLRSTIATLNIANGERVMIIKTHGRDWAIVTGRWEGLRRGVKGSFSSRGVAGSPGCLVVKVFCPIGAPAYTVKLPYDKQVFAFQMPNLFIDMENGILKISHETDELVEHIALGLSITVLHVLCQPRIEMDDVDGDVSPLPIPDMPKRIPTEKLKFLAALGFFCASAPTNTALRKRRDSDDESEKHRGYHSSGLYYPLMAFPFITTDVGACGTCGGCGGCGGGVFETIAPPSSTLWGSSKASGDGGEGGSDWYGGGESNDWGWSSGDNPSFGDMFFGGGDGDGGGGGGDSGACGGCGGCGG